VQDSKDTQAYNRYTYVRNNPLTLTDPSGFFGLGNLVDPFGLGRQSFDAIKPYVPVIAAVVFTVAGCPACAAAFNAGWTLANGGSFTDAVGVGMSTYALSSLAMGNFGGLSGAQIAIRVGFAAFAGGVMSELQGGKFGAGFLAAGLGAGAGGAMEGVNWGNASRATIVTAKIIVGGIVGGTASALTGGKFANGAALGAFAAALYEGIASTDTRLYDGDGSTEYIDSQVGESATRDANEALGDVLQTTYASEEDAAKAWSGKVRAIANKYDTEIASKNFGVKGGYRLGSAYSDGVICSRGGCSVEPNLGGDVSGGVRVGVIHNHPGNDIFSGRDLRTTAYDSRYFRVNQTAFVSLRNGEIWKWSAKSYFDLDNPLPRWEDYNRFSEKLK